MKFLTICAFTVVLAIAGLGAACSDDDSGKTTLSLDEYFQQLDEVQNDTDARFAELEEPTPAPDASDEERADLLRENLQEWVDILRDAAEAAGDLEAPDEVDQAHNDLADGAGATADAIQSVIDDLPDALTLAELESGEFFDTPDLNAASMSIDEACVALQQIAADNSIDVDLECSATE